MEEFVAPRVSESRRDHVRNNFSFEQAPADVCRAERATPKPNCGGAYKGAGHGWGGWARWRCSWTRKAVAPMPSGVLASCGVILLPTFVSVRGGLRPSAGLADTVYVRVGWALFRQAFGNGRSRHPPRSIQKAIKPTASPTRLGEFHRGATFFEGRPTGDCKLRADRLRPFICRLGWRGP